MQPGTNLFIKVRAFDAEVFNGLLAIEAAALIQGKLHVPPVLFWL
jgi:hypothetical protein